GCRPTKSCTCATRPPASPSSCSSRATSSRTDQAHPRRWGSFRWAALLFELTCAARNVSIRLVPAFDEKPTYPTGSPGVSPAKPAVFGVASHLPVSESRNWEQNHAAVPGLTSHVLRRHLSA